MVRVPVGHRPRPTSATDGSMSKEYVQPLIASEEVVDPQTRIEQFRGREIDFATGQDSSGWLAPGVPASGVDVRAASGTAAEMAGVTVLRSVLAEHELRRWMFTDLVMIDGASAVASAIR
jgi:hypothetical protein